MLNPQCVQCSKTFRIDDQDFVYYKTRHVPPPTFCPSCRLQRRLAWRNERSLYQRPCGQCGKVTVCLQRPDGPLTMYCSACWWSDIWNPLDYGKPYDWSRSFFEQLQELLFKVPQQNTDGMYATLDNSEFNNMNHYLRNCYLLFNSDYNDNCSYGTEIEHSKDCVDNTMLDQSELCYECVNCVQCYKAFFSVDCVNSNHIWFSKNLVNCHNCIGSINLRNKEYYIFNTPYSKAEYEKKVLTLKLGSFEALKMVSKQSYDIWLRHPHRYIHGTRNEHVSGDYIYNSKNTLDTFIATEADNCRYCMWLIVKNNRDCYDYTQFGENVENIYESVVCGKDSSDIIGGFRILECESIRYSLHCYGSKNLFGCVGLRNQQYCILNTQYSKEQYESLVPRIIEHMNTQPFIDTKGRTHVYGDFYPIVLSPFAYNESTAYQFFPLTDADIQAQGYGWMASEPKPQQATLRAEQIVDHIAEVDQTILQEVIGCACLADKPAQAASCQHQCTQQFKITAAELKFYQANRVPLPRRCPNCRHYQRVTQRNPLQLWQRQCMCLPRRQAGTQPDHTHQGRCAAQFETTYSPDRKELVYCEQCYQKEIY